MKKLILASIIAMVALYADWMRIAGLSDNPLPPNIYVLKSDTAGLTLTANIFGFTKKDTIIDDKTFQRVEIPEQYKYHDSLYKGKPQIPYIRLLIAIPDSCGFNITVLPGEATTFNQYLIYPVPRVAFGDSDGLVYSHEVYTYDTAFYNKDTLYPNMYYTVNSTGHWRDQRVIELFLYPVQHNPQKQTMDFYTSLYVQINYTGSKYANENGLGPFEDIGRDILINYPGIERQPNPHPNPAVHYYTDLINPANDADYIIVTHDMFIFNETTSRWINDFAQWRVDHNNFDVGIVTVQDIYEEFPPGPTYDSVASLHDFLVYAYENWQAHVSPDGHFGYCLFIGDWDFVPTETIPYYMSDPNPPYFYRWLGANEYKFADLYEDGTIDIMLGRWPVKGTYDLVAIAQKTLYYEKYPDNIGNWRREGVLISGGDWQDPLMETYFNNLVTLSKPFLSDIGYDTLSVRWLSYKPNENAYLHSIHNHLNNGALMTSYYDHGAPDGWFAHYSSHNVKDLINGTRLPVVLSNACLTAMFQWDKPSSTDHPDYEPDTSMGEHFLINPNGGAVAFFGSTAYSIMPDMFKMLEYAFRYQYWILGKFVLPGLYGTGEPGHCYCLLGDPVLDLGDYTAIPDKPDLVVRPLGMDIKVQPPYPYPRSGDVIPVQALVWNIGATTAYDVQVELDIEFPPTTVIGTTIIPQILPRDTALATIYWNTGITHPGYYGELGNAKFIIKVDPTDLIDETWELNNQSSVTGRVALYPNQMGWPKKVSAMSQPALANIDGAGTIEIVYHSAESIYVYRPDGTQAPGWPQQFEGVHGLVVGDIDNNGLLEIVAVSSDYIKAYNYQGILLWSQQVPPSHPNHAFDGLPSLGHIQGQQTLEILIFMRYKSEGTTPDYPLIKIYDNTGNSVGEYRTSMQCIRSRCLGMSISNVNDDAMEEFVVAYDYGGYPNPYKLDIFNCSQLQPIDSRPYGSFTIPALADLTGDGISDITIGCADNYIRAYNARFLQELWAQFTGGAINSSAAIGDIHPSVLYPGVEITFGNDASEIHLREKDFGDNIPPWWYIISPSTMVQTSPAIANVNNDRYKDIVFGADNQYIYAFKYDMSQIPPFPLPLFGTAHSSPVIGDVDGDRKSEIVLVSNDGYLHMWKNLNSKVPLWSLDWPQFHHDYQRTGLYGWVNGLSAGDANPAEFSTATTILLTLEKNSPTKVKVYDSEGNYIRTLVDQVLQSGTYHPVWDGKDSNYSFMPNGLYFIEIRIRGESRILPVVINR